METCAFTWGKFKPLYHYSESHPEKTNPRAHADMPTDCPASDAYDWDIELKSKDAAIRACAALVGVWQMSGKGDRQRPVDKDTYDKNYEEIEWDKDESVSTTRK